MKAIATKVDHFAVNVGTLAVSGTLEKNLGFGLFCYEDLNGDFIILDKDSDGEIVKCSAKFSTALELGLAEPGFIPVPASIIKWGDKTIAVPAFQIEQYLASVDDDGNAIRTTTGKPVNNIDYEDAIKAAIDGGVTLQRGSQALAVALNIMSVDKNWTGGKVGEGELYRGLYKGTVSGHVTNDYESPHATERRWLELSNGYKIYDWSGHLWEWMFDDIHGDEDGIVSGKIPADSPYLKSSPYPSMEKGVGYIFTGPLSWSSRALFRGGCWSSDGSAGAFNLHYFSPGYSGDDLGFRCTKPSPGL